MPAQNAPVSLSGSNPAMTKSHHAVPGKDQSRPGSVWVDVGIGNGVGRGSDESFLLRLNLEVTSVMDVVWSEFCKPHGFRGSSTAPSAADQNATP
jgi:hypothetical protein